MRLPNLKIVISATTTITSKTVRTQGLPHVTYDAPFGRMPIGLVPACFFAIES